MSKKSLIMLLAAVTALAWVGTAQAEQGFHHGHWRVELAVGTGVDSGSTDRAGDILTIGSVEYEFPVSNHVALGLRLLPLVVYSQDNENDDWYEDWFHDDDDGGDTVWGGGFGFVTRVYQVAQEQRGIFLEMEANALFHANRFNGNSSNVNFLTGIGLGYKFKRDFHLTTRFEHISNAGLGDDNAGVNAVTIAFGYSF